MFNVNEYRFSPKKEIRDENGQLVNIYQDGLKLNNFKNVVGKDNPEFMSSK